MTLVLPVPSKLTELQWKYIGVILQKFMCYGHFLIVLMETK